MFKLILASMDFKDLNLSRFNSLDEAFQSFLRLATLLAALIAVGVLIYGGVMYIISAGDSGKTEKAQNTIIYALVGLVIVALSWLVVEFMLNILGIDALSLEEIVSNN